MPVDASRVLPNPARKRPMHLTTSALHHVWDSDIPPATTVEAGAELTLDLVESSGGQLSQESTAPDLARLDFDLVDAVTGPIAVEGAMPGDAIVVSILDITVGSWGWSACIPGFGLLADRFPDPYLAISRIREDAVELPFGIELPVVPMLGTIGVAPPEAGPHPVLPPRRWGGNLDVRHLTRGARVVLPVGVAGALLSVGDAHAAMGDGEVSGTGVETDATARIRIDLIPGRAPASPWYETDPVSDRRGPFFSTTGIGPDVHRAAVEATDRMVDAIVERTDLAAEEAYVLVSLTGDLRISEIVDVPNWVVSMHVPLGLLHP